MTSPFRAGGRKVIEFLKQYLFGKPHLDIANDKAFSECNITSFFKISTLAEIQETEDGIIIYTIITV